MNKLHKMLKIADIHASRIELALSELKSIFPIDEHKVEIFTREELLFTELLVSRFAKLQDLIGEKVIDALFLEKDERVENLMIIDKLNKLERLEIIDNVEIWKEMRDTRNYLAHEYPENPEKTAENLNALVALSPKLLKILQNIKDRSK